MSAHNAVTPDKLARLVALPGSPRLVELGDAPPKAIPGSRLDVSKTTGRWGFTDVTPFIIVDADGGADAPLATAILRREGGAAEMLEGGFAACRDAPGEQYNWTSHQPSRGKV